MNNELESTDVRKLFTTFVEEGSARKTQIRLIEEGIFNKKYTNKHGPEKGGNVFKVDTLQTLLTNPINLGKCEVVHADGNRELIPAVWKPIAEARYF